MVQSSIEQKRAFVTIRAEIEEDGVAICERGLLATYRAKVPFEEIPEYPFEQAARPPGWILAAVLGFAVFVRLLLHWLVVEGAGVEPVLWAALVTALAALRVWEKSANFVGYRCSSGRLLFFDQSGARSPRPFLTELQRRRSEYFREYAEAYARGDDGPATPGRTSGAWVH
jgi:hypothetical protein